MKNDFEKLIIPSRRLFDFGFVGGRLQESARILQEFSQNPRTLFALSEWARRSYFDFDVYAGPHDAAKIGSISDVIHLTGLASFSRDGFVREMALTNLSLYGVPQVLPFVILRLQDWVPVISQKANVVFVKVAPKASLEDWNYVSPIVKRLERRASGQDIRLLVTNEVKRKFQPRQRFAAIKHSSPEFREILWETLFDEACFTEEVSSHLKYETTPMIAQKVFQAAFSSVSIDEVCDAAFEHPLQSIRQSALRVLAKADHNELRERTIDALADRSGGVRDFARFLARTKLEFDPHKYFRENRPDQNSPIGHVLGWLETTKVSDIDEVLNLYITSPRGKIRGAALVAYARLANYDASTPQLLADAIKSDGHSRRSALKLIRMGWAGPISVQLWELVDAEDEIVRKLQLMKLASDSNRIGSLLPLLKLMAFPDLEVKNLVVKLIHAWNQSPLKSRLPDGDKKVATILCSKLNPQDQGRLSFLRL